MRNNGGWHTQKSQSNLYRTERSILERGLNGDFRILKLYEPEKNGGRLLVIGELKFDQNKVQTVQILFSVQYPYYPPRVTPLSKTPIPGPFEYTAKHFNKGNQYSDGAMCLMRTDQWNRHEHNIGWCLRRAQEWLTYASSTSGFPKDKIVLENPAFMVHAGQVLMSKLFVPPDSKSGEFTLTAFKPNHYILQQNIIPHSVFNLTVGRETFKWYKLQPGVQMKDIFNHFLNNLPEFFRINFGENILEGPATQNFALYLPDDVNKWYFFKIQLQNLLGRNNLSVQYYIARIVEQELFLRTQDIFDDKILGTKRVTIVGLGALGSEVARSMAKNGVGSYSLFDFDTFEIGNSIRHAADLYYVGELKVDVAKQLILRSNPNSLVDTYNLNVLDDTGMLDAAIGKSDLCIVLTAEDQVDYYINELYCNKYDIPFVFARVSSGGLSGSIQIVEPQSACLRCLNLYGADTLPLPKDAPKFDELPPEYGSCSTPAFPGSEVDTKEVAIQVARVSLQLLLKNSRTHYAPLQGFQYFWHGPFGSKTKKPFTWEIKKIGKHAQCEVCNHKD